MSVETLYQQFIESDGLWAIERLRAFDVAFHSFKYHHTRFLETIRADSPTQYELAQQFIAYSGSIFPVRDQAEQFCRYLSEASQEAYRTRLYETVDLEVSDFLIELRNYVQHTHIPFLFSPENVSPRYTFRSAEIDTGVYLHVDELRDRGREFRKEHAKQFLESHEGELIAVEPLLERYFDDSVTFNQWVLGQFRDEHADAIAEARELHDSIVEAISDH
ncbi:hypothetical protein G6M89_02240 [Natronolimnobius sp. AArcel1]|uniref:hypothetical protein n=1 Tax=Natronolimnobius sp. AArcel1 TaxID=1679093 RepID=UPI0013EBCF8C|nr:hypothetical protein [Natronolimnobius sp. AArcel1]NGM67840.1 hypothetical protein [Natronolimnobius sp. AArcel1]